MDRRSFNQGESVGNAGAALLGQRLRALRAKRRVTLRDLAHRADLSVGMLSQIERGLSSPSIRSLQRLAKAFDIPVSWFFEDPSLNHGADTVAGAAHAQTGGELWVLRRPARRVLALDRNGVTKELLAPPGDGGAIDMILVAIEPGGSSGPHAYHHDGEDAGLVLEGAVRLEVDGRATTLGAGDSFRFASRLPHRFDNPGSVRAVVVWAVTPPWF